MLTPEPRAVVSVRFPFSDLSRTKLRPAVILADVGRDDWILCQVISKPYGGTRTIALTEPLRVFGKFGRVDEGPHT